MTEASSRLRVALQGRYRLDRELGAGGMATVYLAHDVKHERDVAIKVLRDDVAQSVGRERFLREIQLAARLSHPHILPLFDSGDADGTLYYVMPVVTGESLRDRLTRERHIPIAEAVRFAVEIAGALEHAHRADVVHRDVKPENILLQDGHALLADFGIGKAIDDASTGTLTQVGMNVGTPAYMSPEQAVGEDVDGRSDLYSLACVLYEMLVGEPPFTGPTVQAVIAKRFVQTPADVTALREGVPRTVAVALQHALQRTPIDRPSINDWTIAMQASPTSAASTAPQRSIAVLAFTNLTADRENEFLGDGIAEDIINLLSRIEGLQVAAKMSAFSFKGKQVEPRVVGDALNVALVLEGSVRKAGNRVRINVQLLSVADKYQLWSERYDRELVDVFAVQDEIAAAIAERLQLTLAPREAPATPVSSEDMEVYELTVRARGLIGQRGSSAIAALACLDRVLAVRPDHPTALALYANAQRSLLSYGAATAADCLPRANAALTRALAIAPDNPEVLAAKAGILNFETIRHRDASRQLYERALLLDPRMAETRVLFAGFILINGGNGSEDAQGIAEIRRAVVDDPRNGAVLSLGGGCLAMAGAIEEGLALCQRALAVDPDGIVSYWTTSMAYLFAGRPAEGIAFVNACVDRFARHPWFVHSLCGFYSLAGDRVRAEAAYAELRARAVLQQVPAFSLAVCACFLGLLDEAMDHAFESVRKHDALNPFVFLRHPGLDLLHTHPRYPELRALM
jgi:serine/threonine protein kinase/tetratricopeptide (TPR) repeat protein